MYCFVLECKLERWLKLLYRLDYIYYNVLMKNCIQKDYQELVVYLIEEPREKLHSDNGELYNIAIHNSPTKPGNATT